MKFKNNISVYFAITIISLSSIHPTNLIVPPITPNNLQSINPSIERNCLTDALSSVLNNVFTQTLEIVSYFSSVETAYEKYMQKNDTEPLIKCAKCTTDIKYLSIGELTGGLIGRTLKDISEGKNNFDKTKLALDNLIKKLSEGSYPDIINEMIRISNEAEQSCSHCHNNSWEKIN